MEGDRDGDGEELRAELLVLQQGLTILLEDEFPLVWENVTENLATAGRVLTKDGMGCDTASFFNDSNFKLNVLLEVQGCHIVSGDLSLQLPKYNRGDPIQVSLRPSRPFLVKQVQNAGNLVRDILGSLERLRPGSRSWDTETLESCLVVATYFVEKLQEVIVLVEQAREELQLRPSSSFARCKQLKSEQFVARTAVPADLAIDFFAQETHLVLGLYLLSSLPGGGGDSGPGNSTPVGGGVGGAANLAPSTTTPTTSTTTTTTTTSSFSSSSSLGTSAPGSSTSLSSGGAALPSRGPSKALSDTLLTTPASIKGRIVQLEGFEARITDYLEFSHPIALWDSALQNLAKASRYLVGTNKKFIFYMQSLRSSLQM